MALVPIAACFFTLAADGPTHGWLQSGDLGVSGAAMGSDGTSINVLPSLSCWGCFIPGLALRKIQLLMQKDHLLSLIAKFLTLGKEL